MVPPPSWRPSPKRAYKQRDPSVTSRMMTTVRARENKAEVLLRKALFALGLRYRVHSRSIPGRPDIVFGPARVVVFVDGDYWHGRALVEGGDDALRQVIRGNRYEWWRAKLARNIARDREVTSLLKSAGWRVIRYWESDVLRDPSRIAHRIARVVHRRRERGLAKS